METSPCSQRVSGGPSQSHMQPPQAPSPGSAVVLASSPAVATQVGGGAWPMQSLGQAAWRARGRAVVPVGRGGGAGVLVRHQPRLLSAGRAPDRTPARPHRRTRAASSAPMTRSGHAPRERCRVHPCSLNHVAILLPSLPFGDEFPSGPAALPVSCEALMKWFGLRCARPMHPSVGTVHGSCPCIRQIVSRVTPRCITSSLWYSAWPRARPRARRPIAVHRRRDGRRSAHQR